MAKPVPLCPKCGSPAKQVYGNISAKFRKCAHGHFWRIPYGSCDSAEWQAWSPLPYKETGHASRQDSRSTVKRERIVALFRDQGFCLTAMETCQRLCMSPETTNYKHIRDLYAEGLLYIKRWLQTKNNKMLEVYAWKHRDNQFDAAKPAGKVARDDAGDARPVRRPRPFLTIERHSNSQF